ncbi:transcription elongation factor GreA [Candidatus Microgenomates bacterium]|nr:MAG: transcription elongation factor GreA [Candidatus Microgenomates bacterium]
MDTNTKQLQVTGDGFKSLKSELEELVNTKRPQLVKRLERARQEGDLTENSDYTNAKEELEFLDGRIDELTHVVNNAEVVEDSSVSRDTVDVGTTVVLTSNGDRHEYKIVGEWEADPMKKLISHESPLGKQLVGKKVGEQVEVEAPAGKISYKVLEIK